MQRVETLRVLYNDREEKKRDGTKVRDGMKEGRKEDEPSP